MAEKKGVVELKEYFRAGYMPTEEQFADLIDSTLNLKDHEVSVNTASNTFTVQGLNVQNDFTVTKNLTVGESLTANKNATLGSNSTNNITLKGKLILNPSSDGSEASPEIIKFNDQDVMESGSRKDVIPTEHTVQKHVEGAIAAVAGDIAGVQAQINVNKDGIEANSTDLSSVQSQANTNTENLETLDSKVNGLNIPDITKIPEPIEVTHASNKGYVDTQVALLEAGLKFKKDVQAVSDTEMRVPLNGTDHIIDGYQLVAENRVLLTKQDSDLSQNRVWVVKAGADWVIAEDFNGDVAGEVSLGTSVEVQNGDTHQNSIWSISRVDKTTVKKTKSAKTADPIIAVEWKKRNDLDHLHAYQSGTGIDIQGQTIALDPTWVSNNLFTGEVEGTLKVKSLPTENAIELYNPVDQQEPAKAFRIKGTASDVELAAEDTRNLLLQSGGNVTLQSGGNATLQSGGNTTLQSGAHVILRPSGNVGIGVEEPLAKLAVNGDVKITGKLTANEIRSQGYIYGKQVAFSAYVTSSIESGILPMKEVSNNFGEGYDTELSRFKAPVSGVYQFSMNVNAEFINNGNLLWFLKVNNEYANENVGTSSGEAKHAVIQIENQKGQQTVIENRSRSVIVKLAKYDEVYVEQKISGGTCQIGFSSLEGVLLSADPQPISQAFA